MKLAALLALPLLAAAAACAPQTASPAGAPETAARASAGGGAAAKPRLVCRREQVTGARTGNNRVCLTQEQWNAIDRGDPVDAPAAKPRS